MAEQLTPEQQAEVAQKRAEMAAAQERDYKARTESGTGATPTTDGSSFTTDGSSLPESEPAPLPPASERAAPEPKAASGKAGK